MCENSYHKNPIGFENHEVCPATYAVSPFSSIEYSGKFFHLTATASDPEKYFHERKVFPLLSSIHLPCAIKFENGWHGRCKKYF